MESDYSVNLQWFPGHMAKTRRQIEADLREVDMAAELLDARIPRSSANPEISELLRGKPRLVLLGKSDLADASATDGWLAALRRENIPSLAVDCRSGRGLSDFPGVCRTMLREKIAHDEARGMKRPLRIMVLGIPNVGKSSLINRMLGERRLKVEDRPGVTRSKQWIRLPDGLELMDTAGVLWPKFEDRTVGENLAFTGAIKDDIIDIETLACAFLQRCAPLYPALFCERYRLAPEDMGAEPYELLETIARRRGFLVSRGEADTKRAARVLLDEFRGGKLGRITLEPSAGKSDG